MRERYIDIYDFAPAGHITLEARGTILDLNLAGAILLGITRYLAICPHLQYVGNELGKSRLSDNRFSTFNRMAAINQALGRFGFPVRDTVTVPPVCTP